MVAHLQQRIIKDRGKDNFALVARSAQSLTMLDFWPLPLSEIVTARNQGCHGSLSVATPAPTL
eukprot:3976514-Alexandrium_andersonii.AAC.1